MTSVDSNFNFLCGRPHGAGPPVHMRPSEPDPLRVDVINGWPLNLFLPHSLTMMHLSTMQYMMPLNSSKEKQQTTRLLTMFDLKNLSHFRLCKGNDDLIHQH